jgi:hypothetical protein
MDSITIRMKLENTAETIAAVKAAVIEAAGHPLPERHPIHARIRENLVIKEVIHGQA